MRSLYERLLGPSFASLPPEVSALRRVPVHCDAVGRCDVRRGRHRGARALAALLRLPKDGTDLPASATYTTDGPREIWHRQFGDVAMRAIHEEGQGRLRGLLVETVGVLSFGFRVTAGPQGLRRRLVAVRLFGIELPKPHALSISGQESVRDGRFRFDVAMDLPCFGPLIRYSGWLEPAVRESPI